MIPCSRLPPIRRYKGGAPILILFGTIAATCFVIIIIGIIVLIRERRTIHPIVNLTLIVLATFGLFYIAIKVTIPISIEEAMIEGMIDDHPMIHNTEIKIDEKAIEITGEATVKKYFITASVEFLIELHPVSANERSLIMKVENVEPVNVEYLNHEIFNQPPYLTYNNGIITLNLNAWKRMDNIPLKIRSYELKHNHILINVGF